MKAKYKITYKSMFSHLTGQERVEYAFGTKEEMLAIMENISHKFYDMRIERMRHG